MSAPIRRPRLARRAGVVVVEAALDRVGFGHLAHRIGQLVRYGAVSIIATLTSTTVLGALVATATLTPGWANIVATGVGTVPSFELNRRWVWGRTGRRSITAEVGPFCVLAFAGLGLSTATVSAAGRWASSAGLPTGGRTAVVLAANVAAFGSLWVLQFVVLDRVLFARRGPGRGSRAGGSGAASQDFAAGPRSGNGGEGGGERGGAAAVPTRETRPLRRPVGHGGRRPWGRNWRRERAAQPVPRRDDLAQGEGRAPGRVQVTTGARALDHRVAPGGAGVVPTSVVRSSALPGSATVAA